MAFVNKNFDRKKYSEENSGRTSEQDEKSCVALYVFNSDTISREVSNMYAAYAEGEFLRCLSRTLQPYGGWSALPPLVQACHGELFERGFGLEKPAIFVLGNCLKAGTFGINVTYLDKNMVNTIKSRKNLGYLPYAVGIGTIMTLYAMDLYQELQVRSPVGYMGMIILENAPLPVIAGHLHLTFNMEIRGTTCKGWQANITIIREVGLDLSRK
jgi:hypothetical protein